MDEWVTAYGTGLLSRFARLPPVRNVMRCEPKEKVEYSDTVRTRSFSHVLSRSSPFLNSAASWAELGVMRRALPESSSRGEKIATKEDFERLKKNSLITIAKGTGPVQRPISHEGYSQPMLTT